MWTAERERMKQKLSLLCVVFSYSVPAEGLDLEHLPSFSHSLFLYFLLLPFLSIHITKQKGEPKMNQK